MKKISNYIVVIPCRKGSKRIKNKNIKKFLGKNLYQYTLEQSLRLFKKKNIIVTTDEKKIINFCKLNKIKFIRRSKNLSTGKTTGMQVLNNVKESINDKNLDFIYLQVTSPLRRDLDIIESINLFEKKKANCLISVTEMFVNPLMCNKIKRNSMYNFIKKKISLIQSQKLEKYYQINGAIYIIKKKFISEKGSFYQIKNSIPFFMKKRNSIDIDDNEDFEIAEKLYEFK